MTYGSICSGIEAATVAWSPLGWSCAFTAEIEPFPCAVLKQHYPDTPNYGDITKFRDWPRERIDVLIGGTPCQSFSVAGLRKGLADPRGNLALTFLAIVERLAPTWVVWENVPGVLSSAGGRDFGSFLGGLGAVGYGFAYAVLDAQYFGLAQRRKRVFVVGHIGGQWQRAAAVLFDAASLCGHPAPGRTPGQGTAPTISARTKGGGGPGSDADCDGAVIAIGFDSKQGGDTQLGYTENGSPPLKGKARHAVAQSLRADGFDASEDGTGRGTPIVIAHGQAGAEMVSDGSPSLTCNHEAPIVFDTTQVTSKGNYSSPKAGDACHPLAEGGHAPAVATRMAVRRLTPRECERLQGFPDDYTLVTYRGKPACDGPRYRALGNSMAVPVIRWLGERIQAVENLRSEI
jgi:DNA (cytosine-5)-methyltransferase 1